MSPSELNPVYQATHSLLQRAGCLRAGPPTPLDRVLGVLAQDGLQIHEYSPQAAPPALRLTASAVDEVLVRDGQRWLLFINQQRSSTRIRFSTFHGIGHFCLPGHRRLNYLSRGCSVQPWTTRVYERQAHTFAALMNMPPSSFRADMADLPFGMASVESLAQRYAASLESATIHYVSLSDAPCAVVWLQPEYDAHGLSVTGSPLRVRYQVRSPSYPFGIRPGTLIPPGAELINLPSREEYFAQGHVDGAVLGLGNDGGLWVECRPQGHAGAVLALLCPSEMPRTSPVYRDWDWGDVD